MTAARLRPSRRLKFSGSVASPHRTRCSPRAHRSPLRVRGRTLAGNTSTLSVSALWVCTSRSRRSLSPAPDGDSSPMRRFSDALSVSAIAPIGSNVARSLADSPSSRSTTSTGKIASGSMSARRCPSRSSRPSGVWRAITAPAIPISANAASRARRWGSGCRRQFAGFAISSSARTRRSSMTRSLIVIACSLSPGAEPAPKPSARRAFQVKPSWSLLGHYLVACHPGMALCRIWHA